MDHVEASPTGGHPIVYGDWLGADGAPTVVVYGHYDVQPVDPLDEWTSPPFEPAVVGSRVLARGAGDDKSNITIFIQAVEALLADPRPACRSTCASCSRARRSRRRSTSSRGSWPTGSG